MAIEYLSLTGLSKYDGKIKEFIDVKVANGTAKSFKAVNLEKGWLKFYTEDPITAGATVAYQVELPEQDLSNLMELVKDATENNLAIFDKNGQVKDSGLALADVATKDEVEVVSTAVDDLKTYVGVIPSEYSETNIVAYVNKKAEETLNAASGGSSESAASVLAALNTYKAENDAKVSANTAAVETAQATADAAKNAANQVSAALEKETTAREDADEALDERITTLEDKIVGITGALHFKGVLESLPEDVSGYEDGDVVIVGNKEYLFNNGNFVEFGDVDAISEALTTLTGKVETLEKIDHDAYKAADAVLKEELTVSIEANATAIEDLEKSLTEITDEQIDALFA